MLDDTPRPHRTTAVAAAIGRELGRQQHQIELIASENIVSRDVLIAQGSVHQQVRRGLPGKRYYGGCEFVDEVGDARHRPGQAPVRRRLRQRPAASGAQANQAVFLALLQPGDRIMGMSSAPAATSPTARRSPCPASGSTS